MSHVFNHGVFLIVHVNKTALGSDRDLQFTCKMHFILSPGAIITVVQTPAKNPEVKI